MVVLAITINNSLSSLRNNIMTITNNNNMASSRPINSNISTAHLHIKITELSHLPDNIFHLAGYSSGIRTASDTTI